MSNITIKEAAAASAVGTNLMAGHRLQTAPRPRYVRRIGVVGSTAAGDASVDMFYGNVYIGTFFNTTPGANVIPLDAKDMVPVSANVGMEPNEPLHVLISKVSAANVLAVTLELVEL